jgi:hypothetical protein
MLVEKIMNILRLLDCSQNFFTCRLCLTFESGSEFYHKVFSRFSSLELIRNLVYYPLLVTALKLWRESGYLSRYRDGLQAARSGFDCRQGHEFLLLSVMTRGGGTQPLIPCAPAVISPWVKEQERQADTHLRLMQRLRMIELYLHSLTGLHGVMPN